MSGSFNVDTFNYDYAHKCYMAYAAGDVDAADSMYDKGKEVAESKKWLSYVTKWQSEDINVYEMEEEEEGAKDQTGNLAAGTIGAASGLAGGAAIAGVAGGLTATVAVTGSTTSISASIATNGLITQIPQISQTANTGSLPAAIVYAAFGTLFLALTIAMKVNAKKDREQQENYFKQAEELMKEDYEEKLAEIAAIDNEITAFTEEATELTKAADIKVSAANTAAGATAVSAEEVSVAAKSNADEGMAEVISELEGFDEGIITNLPRLESICKEVEVKKGRFTTLRQEIPNFEKNRKQQITLMTILAAGAAAGAIAGGIGLGMAWTNYLLAPAAMAIFIAGIALFAASAIVAGTEIPAQKKSREKLNNENTKDVNEGIEKTNQTFSEASSVLNKGLLNDAAVTQLEEEAAEEDANVNENEVSENPMLAAMPSGAETESAIAA